MTFIDENPTIRSTSLAELRKQSHPCADNRLTSDSVHTTPRLTIGDLHQYYNDFSNTTVDHVDARRRGVAILNQVLHEVEQGEDGGTPGSPNALEAWMKCEAGKATAAYQTYLTQRKDGAPRRYFSTRSHALYFIQRAAPTKLVDGSWLYGTLRHARDPRMRGLVQTYLEELGNGDESKNHVLLYKHLLAAHGLNSGEDLDSELFVQGAIQLALGYCTEAFLPEVIGFNLGYEQLPLHLLITSYELNELGIDP